MNILVAVRHRRRRSNNLFRQFFFLLKVNLLTEFRLLRSKFVNFGFQRSILCLNFGLKGQHFGFNLIIGQFCCFNVFIITLFQLIKENNHQKLIASGLCSAECDVIDGTE